MKHFITACAILFVIAASSIFITQYMTHVSEEMLDTLNSCEESIAAGNWEDAEKQIEKTEEIWKEQSPKLSAFVLHHDIDGISEALTRTSSFVKVKERDDFFIENQYLTELISKLKLMNKLNFENLF